MKNENLVNSSVWSLGAPVSTYPSLKGTVETDVVIIGGGITGISAAWMLAQHGVNVVVLEAWQVGNGTTGNSTGNLYSVVDERLYQIRKNFSEEIMQEVTASRKAALDYIEGIINHFSLECDFSRQPWHLVATSDDFLKVIDKEFSAAVNAKLDASLHETIALPFPVKRALRINDQAQFNPLKYVKQLAEKIKDQCSIYEYSKVEVIEELDHPVVHTAEGKVVCKTVIMATHVPKGLLKIQNYLGPYREYGIAFHLKEGSHPPDGIFWTLSEGHHFSFRNYRTNGREFLIVVGAPHKVGQGNPAECVRELEKFAEEHFTVTGKYYQWSGQHYHSADGLPYIGEHKKNIYYGTGYATDGLIYGTIAAQILSDIIREKKNPYSEIYRPDRHNPIATMGDALKENLNVAGQMMKDWPGGAGVSSVKEIPVGKGCIMVQNGEKIAVFRDENDGISAVSAVCTHMQCIVNWNDVSGSWDCPCHGSRFDTNGKILEGPAMMDLPQIILKKG